MNWEFNGRVKGTAMQIKNALINNRLRVSNVA